MAAQQFLTQDEFFDQSMPGDAFSTLSPTAVTTALIWASGVASSYLRKRYNLPLVSWGEDLKSNVGELAQFKLLGRRGARPNAGSEDLAIKRYDDAVAWFKDVARGLVEVDCVDSTPDVDEEGTLTSSDAPMNWRMTTGPRRCR